jgi:hypothetical protein
LLSSHYLASPPTIAAGRQTRSIYVKAGTCSKIKLARGSDSSGTRFDLSTGTVYLNDSGYTGTIQAAGGGWYRIQTTRPDMLANDTLIVHMLDDATWGVTYTGTSRTISLWGGQVEGASSSSVAGDYIPTTTATVSRIDYTLGALGLVTLPAVLPSGVQLSWSGSFYRRVRFAQRGLSMQRLMQGLWSAEGVELEQVI